MLPSLLCLSQCLCSYPGFLDVLPETPLIESLNLRLPEVLNDKVYSYVQTHNLYLLLIQDRSFNLFLVKLQEYAALSSIDETIEFFWEFNRSEIEACLDTDMIESAWSTDEPLLGLRDAAFMFIELRKTLVSAII